MQSAAPAQGDLLYMWIVAAIFLVLAWTVHTGSWITSAKADVVSSTFQVDPAEQDDTITTPSFFIQKKSNVLIKSGASLDNDWLELRLSLANELSNKEYSLVQAMEYYHGHDSDGYWSGSPNSKTVCLRCLRGLIDCSSMWTPVRSPNINLRNFLETRRRRFYVLDQSC